MHERLTSSLSRLAQPRIFAGADERYPHGRRARSSPQLGGHRRTPSRARPRDAPRRRLLRGRLRQAAGRRCLVVERGDPVQLPPRQARRAREGRRPPGRVGAARVRHDRRLRRDRDGPRGHEGVADEPRPDRRLGRAGDARRAVRRARRDRRLRQVRAGDDDGDGPAEPAGRLPLRRHDPPGHVQGPRHHDPGRVRGRRRPREGHDRRRRAARDRARRVSHHRIVRRDVHREHDGGRGRGDRPLAPGRRVPARRGLPAGGVRARERHPRRRARRRGRAAAAGHPHEGGVRERDHGGDGARRLDERRAAPARDRPRGGRRPRARRLRPRVARDAAPRRRAARRASS